MIIEFVEGKKIRKPTVNETGIYGFFGEFRWLSNFHKCPITIEGLTYPSTENAYQALKSLDQATRVRFSEITPSKSKAISHDIEIREDWDHLRVGIMTMLLMKKYAIPELQEKLLLTDGYYLEETNDWGDHFWGVDGHGKNMLGILTMLVRDHYKGLKT